MATINQLSATDSPRSADQLPIYSAGNGDARKLSLSALVQFLSTAFTTFTASSYVKVTPVLVSNLPSATVAGAGSLAFVADATNTNFHQVVNGGGSNFVPVYSDGTAWRIG
jgi:hypothetical protein